ncbi:MAG: virB2 [Alphaproteobacteria bacterium]|nr:MAG: virB2 [Caulobacteraceae bacterium]TPW02566.1 MAG: virB2 [Alphaproteobacteria bacterium]
MTDGSETRASPSMRRLQLRALLRSFSMPTAVGAGVVLASPSAHAQAAGGGILQPVQGVLQEIVTTLTGPLGVLVGALCLVGIGVLWATGRLDVRAAVSSIFGIALIGTALVVAEAVFAAAGA